MIEHRDDTNHSITEYHGKEPQPRLPNNIELFILGIIIIWVFGAIAANH